MYITWQIIKNYSNIIEQLVGIQKYQIMYLYN